MSTLKFKIQTVYLAKHYYLLLGVVRGSLGPLDGPWTVRWVCERPTVG